MRFGFWIAPLFMTVGCTGPTGPASTNTSSDTLHSHRERVEFLERYVTFHRTYTDLGFYIQYQNNSEGLPGPSVWDIRLVAVVPPNELNDWLPVGVNAEPSSEIDWLADIPGSQRAAEIKEWYKGPNLLVGVDRERSIIAYRRWTR